MKAKLRHYTVEQILEGFVFNELEGKGLFGLAGKLVIQPEYQRHYIYGDGKRDVDVISSLLTRSSRRAAAHHKRRPIRDWQVRDPS